MNKYIRTKKLLRKLVVNAINFISFQRNPLITLNYASMGQQFYWLFIFGQRTLQQNFEVENNNKDRQQP